MSNDPRIFFEEKQNQPIYLRFGLPVLVVAIAIGIQVYDPGPSPGIGPGAATTIIMLSIAIIITSTKLITRVDSEKVSIRRRFSIYDETPMHQIKTAEARSYKDASKEYGQYALLASSAYSYIGDMGVVIHRHEGNPIFISSRRASELVAAIIDARETFEQSQYITN